MIEDIAGLRPFPRGVVQCRDAFATGETLQLLHLTYQITQEDPDHPWHAFTRWAELRAIHIQIELAQIYYASKALDVPPPPLSTHPERRLAAVEGLMEWIGNELIGDHEEIHRLCFNIGCHCVVFIDDNLAPYTEREDEAVKAKLRDQAAAPIRTLLATILRRYGRMKAERADGPEQNEQIAKIAEALFGSTQVDVSDPEAIDQTVEALDAALLISNAKHVIVPSADSFFAAVHHEPTPLQPAQVDWKWLKAGVQALFDAGHKRPAVMRSMNGAIGTGALSGWEQNFLAEITDPATEVYFLDELAGFSTASKMTWDELMNGGIVFPAATPTDASGSSAPPTASG